MALSRRAPQRSSSRGCTLRAAPRPAPAPVPLCLSSCRRRSSAAAGSSEPSPADGTAPSTSSSLFAGIEENPLEQLRRTRDPARRSALLQQLDTTWSEWSERYLPSPVEAYFSQELGIWKETVMIAAVQNPDLAELSVEEQVRPAVRALRAAGVDPQAIWFTATKCPHLLAMPAGQLSRWVDFLSVYGLRPRDLQNFLLRAPRGMLQETTLYEAGLVVTLLKGLGISDAYLAARVLCIFPSVLGCDVGGQLRPVIGWLMSLGLEVVEVGRVVCVWPELLLCSVEGQLRPFGAYLRGLGCTTEQVAEVLVRCPHLLGFKPQDVFGKVLASLERAGMGPDDVRAMLGRSAAFLISSGVQDALDALRGPGCAFSQEQVRQLALAAPEVLVVNAGELQRTMRFLSTVGAGVPDVMACPQLLARGLASTVGPRASFVHERPALRARFHATTGAVPQAAAAVAAAPAAAAADLMPLQGQEESSSPAAAGAAAGPSEAGGASGPAAAAAAAGGALPRLAAGVPLQGQGGTQQQQQQHPPLDFGRLLDQADDDVAWCAAAGISVNEFIGHKKSFDDQYSERLHQDSAQEFQAELKKLGIYEGQ